METISKEFQYITSDSVGKVLYEGLTCLYQTKPQQPVTYLANWLLNHCATLDNQNLHTETEKTKETLLAKLDAEKLAQLDAQKKQQELKTTNDNIHTTFKNRIQGHLYHDEMLSEELPEFLKQQTSLPAVYIGRRLYPLKQVTEEDEDPNAHLDMTQEQIITYIGASKEQKRYIVGKQLQPETGVTYDVLKPKEEQEEQAQQGEEEGEETGAEKTAKPTYLYVPDVTQEPRMTFFRIPRLGAYIACPMVYRSVLSEQAFDAGVVERQRVELAKEEQLKEKETKNAEYQQKIEEAEDQGLDTKEIEEEWKNIVWEEILEKDFESVAREFVVCADTLGEDREIPEEQRKQIEDYAKYFVECWEQSERKQLSADVDSQVKYLKEFKKEEYLTEFNEKMKEDIEERIRQQDIAIEGENQELKTNYVQAVARTEFLRDTLQEEEIKSLVTSLAERRAVKFLGLIQNALFLTGSSVEQVNIPGTNNLDWKRVKSWLSDEKDGLFARLQGYQYKGAKPEKVKSYCRPQKILKKLEGYVFEDVENYNMGLAIVYKFIKQAAETRILDVELRKAEKAAQKAHRENKIQEAEALKAAKEQALEEAKAQAQAQAQEGEEEEFDLEEWEREWEENHPEVVIPDEVVDDVDADVEEENQENKENV